MLQVHCQATLLYKFCMLFTVCISPNSDPHFIAKGFRNSTIKCNLESLLLDFSISPVYPRLSPKIIRFEQELLKHWIADVVRNWRCGITVTVPGNILFP